MPHPTRTPVRLAAVGLAVALVTVAGCTPRPTDSTAPTTDTESARGSTTAPVTPVDAAAVPAVSAVQVHTFAANGSTATTTPLADGSTLTLPDLGADKFNLVAVPATEDGLGSVHLVLSGPVTIDRVENDPIYTVAAQPTNLSVSAGDLPAGSYTLTATPYSADDAKGTAGTKTTLKFTVKTAADQPTPQPTQPPADQGGNTGTGGSGSTKTGVQAGFTAFKPSADSRVIYISSSQGSDSNDCLSAKTPCKTVDAGVKKMRAGYPDHVYLKAGDTWRDDTLTGVKSGRSAAEPAVIAFYGTGSRPVLETAHQRGLAFNTQRQGLLSHVHFIGIELDNYMLDASNPAFTGKSTDKQTAIFLGGHRDILLEDMRFNHMELVVQDWEGKAPTDIVIRRNIFTGAYTDSSSYNQTKRPSNIYASGVDGLTITENVFDHGGWHPTAKGAGANMYNHNLYLQVSNVGAKVRVSNNIITRASSHGVHGRAGGRISDNFVARNAVNLQMGYNGADNALKAGTPVEAHDNVISEGFSMLKGKDHCQGTNLCTAAFWGLHLANPGTSSPSFRNNVIAGQAPQDSAWQAKYSKLSASGLNLPSNPPGTYQNNIVWKWNRSPDQGPGNYPDPGRTLGSYHQELTRSRVPSALVASGFVTKVRPGSDDFDAFMNLALDRELQHWDERITAHSINTYIRAGYGLAEADPGW